MALLLTVGPLLLFGMPTARGISIADVNFTGCAARACTVPFTLGVAIPVSGDPPFAASFAWGDNTNTSVLVNNGTTSFVNGAHTYTTPGNYTLSILIIGSDSAAYLGHFSVAAWTAGYYGTVGMQAFIEGSGYVDSLQRKSGDANTITAFIHNTGSLAITGNLVASFYAYNWAHDCGDYAVPGALTPGSWLYVTTADIDASLCVGYTPWWVKITSPSYPGLNVTSAQMPVNWSGTGHPVAALTLDPAVQSINTATGTFVVPYVRYRITNVGSFTLDFYGTLTQSPVGQFGTYPTDLGNPWNGLTVVQSEAGLLGGSPYFNQGERQQATVGGVYMTPRIRRILLQPGQYIDIDRTFYAVGAASSATISLTDTIQPSCPTDSSYTQVDSTLSCGYAEQPLPVSATVQATISAQGATIYTAGAATYGNGTVQFSGGVQSMGATAGQLATYFYFWKTATPSDVHYVTGPYVSAPTMVQVIVTGLDQFTNYTVQFAVQAAGGPLIYGNVLNFRTQGCSGSSCTGPGGSNGTAPTSNFIGSWLYAVGAAAGFPPEILGYFIGLTLMVAVAGVFLYFDVPDFRIIAIVEIPTVLINVYLFLWPPVIALILIVAIAVLLFAAITGGFTGGGGAPAP